MKKKLNFSNIKKESIYIPENRMKDNYSQVNNVDTRMNEIEINKEARHSIDVSFSPHNFVESPVTINNRMALLSRNSRFPFENQQSTRQQFSNPKIVQIKQIKVFNMNELSGHTHEPQKLKFPKQFKKKGLDSIHKYYN